jgi:putative tricarboxylic transport membrane protein
MMRRSELGSAALLLAFGLAALFEAARLSFGEAGRPGPGFFPFYLALALSLAAAVLVLEALLGPARAFDGGAWEWRSASRIARVLFALLAYALFFEPIGFLPATVALMLFLFRAVEPVSWPAAVGGSLLSAVATYVLFKLWLQVPLPGGLPGL